MTMSAVLHFPRAPTLPLTESPSRNKEFAAIVERLAAGRSNRALADITGVNATSIGDMRWGRVVSYKLLQRFADGVEAPVEDRRALFAAAGYRDEDWDPDKAFMDGIREIAAEIGVPVIISADDLALARQGPEGVQEALAAVRARPKEKNR